MARKPSARRDCVWVPLGSAPEIAARIAAAPARGRGSAVRALLIAALARPEERDLGPVRRFRLEPRGEGALAIPARLQVRLNPERGPADRGLVRYLRNVPAQRRGSETIRLLRALLGSPLDAPSHDWTRPARLPGAGRIPDLRPVRRADGSLEWVPLRAR